MADKDPQLDQLWFTWSTSGLGQMSMGYRIRAASAGLYDVQSMRYRRVTRFLSYELPQGVSVNDFNSRIAPVSLLFVHNGDEQLLIRKVFTGHDAVGRNQAFFTHLIAGLPSPFTAREAIRLWYCPDLWVESEQGKASNDTTLPTIPYSIIQTAVQHSQTSFSFVQISEPLKNLLLLILSQGVPEHIYVTGPSVFTAALIYGLTHCLPMTLLKDFSFTTYESNVHETEMILVGTISGADLFDMTGLKVQPSAPNRLPSTDMQNYALTAVNCLLTGSMDKLNKLIKEAETRCYDTTAELIQLFMQRFRVGPLTVEQVKNIVTFPNDNIDELLDPGIQQESANLLLTNRDYWQKEGKSIFSAAANWLKLDVKSSLTQSAREALATFLNAVSLHALAAMRTDIVQGRMPAYPGDILTTLAPPATNATLYQKILADFAQGEVYQKATSEPFWYFHRWLLLLAKEIQPQPAAQQMLPWLHILSWDKLDQALKLGLPDEWEQLAMAELIARPLPKSAVQVVQTQETKFTSLLQRLLHQGNQLPKPEFTDVTIRFFAALVEYEYPNRVPLLLSLLNTFPKDLMVVEKLVSLVRFATPHQLTTAEIDRVLTECRPEVLAACDSSPSLTEYIREYIFYLTPGKLNQEKVQKLLAQLTKITTLPDFLENPLTHWTVIAEFSRQHTLNRESLEDVRLALKHLFPGAQTEGSPHATSFDKSHELHRQTVIAEIFLILVIQIKTEHDLETVMEILGPQLTPTPWESLCRLGELAGQSYNQPPTAHRLTPYLLCGINNAHQNSSPPEKLDAYLQSLYGNIDDKALKNIDVAVTLAIWPDLIQKEWRAWRKRAKPDWKATIPTVNKFIPQQPAPPTGQSSALQLSPILQRTIPRTPADPPPVQQPSRPDSSQRLPVAPSVQLQITATVYDRKYQVTVKEYQALQQILVRMLPYWINVLNDYLQKQPSKSVIFEMDTILALKDELFKFSPKVASPMLLEYLTDDILLQLEIEKMRRGEEPVQYLQPEIYLVQRRNDFQRFLGDFTYQSYTEKSINDALTLLIRRFHFIQHMDADRKDRWRRWIERERKHVIIELPKHNRK